MARFVTLFCAVTVLSLAGVTAHAQYYPPGPPPGSPPGPPPYPYYDNAAPPPPYYEQRTRLGFRCDASAATPTGGRAIVCPLRRPRPLETRCECPPPPPPPGYSYGPPLPGRVIP